jgi:protein O-GlcNAc transferase
MSTPNPPEWKQLLAQKQMAAAITALQTACSQQPDNAGLWLTLALACEVDARRADALQAIDHAQRLAPGAPALRAVWPFFALQRLPATLEDQLAGVQQFLQRLEVNRQWLAKHPDQALQIAPVVHLLAPFPLAYVPHNVTPALRAWGLWVQAVLASGTTQPAVAPAQRPAGSPFRLAVVSQHLHRHSVWNVLLRGLVRHAAAARVELILLGDASYADDQTTWALSHSTRHHMQPDRWEQALSAEQPDAILYPELGMEPAVLHLASRRLAPVQAAWWGHPVTSGLPTIDLYFSGQLLEPPDADAHYTERLIRLPGTGACTPLLANDRAPLPAELEASLFAAGKIVALVPATPFKLTPQDDALWAELAAINPNLLLVFFSLPSMAHVSQQTHARVAEALRQRGANPAQMQCLPMLPPGQFQTLLERADLYLDVPGFSGFTTAWQAAFAGLPVVTLEGPFLRQRLAAGLLRAIGQPDTIVGTVPHYVAKVQALAQQRQADPMGWMMRRMAFKQAAPLACNDARPVHQLLQTLKDARNAQAG